MQKNDWKQFQETMISLYGAFVVEPVDSQIKAYWLALSHLPIETVVKLLLRAMMSCENYGRIPSIAAILKLLEPDKIKIEQIAILRWNKVLSTISWHGVGTTVDFQDKLVNAAVLQSGGWIELGGCPPDQIEWTRKAFIRAYIDLTINGCSEELKRPLRGRHSEWEPQYVAIEGMESVDTKALSGKIQTEKQFAKSVLDKVDKINKDKK